MFRSSALGQCVALGVGVAAVHGVLLIRPRSTCADGGCLRPCPDGSGDGSGSGLAGRLADLRGSARRWVLAGRVPASMRRNRKAINNCQGGDALAPPPVGDNLRRRRFGYGQRSLEERPCRHAVPLGRDVHVDDLPVLVDGAVDIAPPAADLDVRFVDPPAIAYRPPEGLAASAHSGVKRCTQR